MRIPKIDLGETLSAMIERGKPVHAAEREAIIRACGYVAELHQAEALYTAARAFLEDARSVMESLEQMTASLARVRESARMALYGAPNADAQSAIDSGGWVNASSVVLGEDSLQRLERLTESVVGLMSDLQATRHDMTNTTTRAPFADKDWTGVLVRIIGILRDANLTWPQVGELVRDDWPGNEVVRGERYRKLLARNETPASQCSGAHPTRRKPGRAKAAKRR